MSHQASSPSFSFQVWELLHLYWTNFKSSLLIYLSILLGLELLIVHSYCLVYQGWPNSLILGFSFEGYMVCSVFASGIYFFVFLSDLLHKPKPASYMLLPMTLRVKAISLVLWGVGVLLLSCLMTMVLTGILWLEAPGLWDSMVLDFRMWLACLSWSRVYEDFFILCTCFFFYFIAIYWCIRIKKTLLAMLASLISYFVCFVFMVINSWPVMDAIEYIASVLRVGDVGLFPVVVWLGDLGMFYFLITRIKYLQHR